MTTPLVPRPPLTRLTLPPTQPRPAAAHHRRQPFRAPLHAPTPLRPRPNVPHANNPKSQIRHSTLGTRATSLRGRATSANHSPRIVPDARSRGAPNATSVSVLLSVGI